MEAYITKVSNYFNTRTPIPGETGIERYLQQMTKSIDKRPDIKVDSNDYLCMSQINFNKSETNTQILMSGIYLKEDDVHGNISSDIAKYVNMNSCLILQSGYISNVCILQATCDTNTPVYIDEKAHASFWDGILTAKAHKILIKHNDISDLENKIKKYGSGIIIVDSIYSAHGSIAPLKEIVDIKKKGNHILIVDESHSLGLYGYKGSGLCSELGLTKNVDFITASLSKAFSTRAGLIASHNKINIDFIKETAIPAIFSSVISISDVIRIKDVLEELKSKSSDLKRERLLNISNFIRNSLQDTFSVIDTPIPSPIICLILKSEEKLRRFQFFIQHRGIFGASFVFPAVSKKSPCVRLTLHSNLTDEDCIRIIDTLKEYHTQNKVKVYSSL